MPGRVAAEHADDEHARLADRDRAVAELERVVGSRGDPARLGQLQRRLAREPVGRSAAEDDDPRWRLGRELERPLDVRLGLGPPARQAVEVFGERTIAEPGPEAHQQRRERGERARHDDGVLVGIGHREGGIGKPAHRAVRAACDSQRRVVALTNGPDDVERLGRGPGARHGDDGLVGRVARREDTAWPEEHLGQWSRDGREPAERRHRLGCDLGDMERGPGARDDDPSRDREPVDIRLGSRPGDIEGRCDGLPAAAGFGPGRGSVEALPDGGGRGR